MFSTMNKNVLLVCMLVGILCSCKEKKIKPKDLVSALQETGQLVTAEYTVRKVVKASDEQTWFKFGNRRILMTCEAHMKAGIDMQQIKEQDIRIKDSVVYVKLPHATMFSLSIPPNKIQMHHEEVGLLRDKFTAMERETLLRQAETQIRSLADSIGILQTAESNASVFVQNLLQQSGIKQVNISFQ